METPLTGTGRSHVRPRARERGPHQEVERRTLMTNGRGKSDSPVVPKKLPNTAAPGATEGVEGRGVAKLNPSERNVPRTQSRKRTLNALERVREAARRWKKQ